MLINSYKIVYLSVFIANLKLGLDYLNNGLFSYLMAKVSSPASELITLSTPASERSLFRYKVRWLTVLFMALALLLAACGGETEPVSEEVPQPTEAASEEEAAPEPTEAASEEEAASESTEAASEEETAASNECLGITVEEGATVFFFGWGDEAEQELYRDSIERFF